MTRRPPRLGSLLRLAALPVVIVVVAIVAWKLGYFDLDRRQRLLDTVQQLRMAPRIEAWFVAAFAIVLAFCLPANIATILAGAVFGSWVGAILSWTGSLIATVLAYVLARTVARRPVTRLFAGHRFLRHLRDLDGIVPLFRLRVVPVAPFAVMPYVAGIAGVSLRRLLIASALGGIPGSIAYAYVGSKLLEGVSGGDSPQRPLWIAAGVTVAMLLLSLLPVLAKKLRD